MVVFGAVDSLARNADPDDSRSIDARRVDALVDLCRPTRVSANLPPIRWCRARLGIRHSSADAGGSLARGSATHRRRALTAPRRRRVKLTAIEQPDALAAVTVAGRMSG